jgi:hypothetical protein
VKSCKPETSESHQSELDTALHLVGYWEKQVELTRKIMSIAVDEYDRARYRLAQEKKGLNELTGLPMEIIK